MVCSYRMIGFETLREVFIDFLKMSSDQTNASLFKLIPYDKLDGLEIIVDGSK